MRLLLDTHVFLLTLVTADGALRAYPLPLLATT
jgi:hypothetical protein